MSRWKKYLSVAIVTFLVLLVAFIVAVVCLINANKVQDINTIEINKVYNGVLNGEYPDCEYDYCYIDSQGNIIYSTIEVEAKSYEAKLNDAIKHGYPVKEVGDNRIIFYINYQKNVANLIKNLIIVISVIGGVMILAMMGYLIYLYFRLIHPFDKLEKFAVKVAGGELDCGLEISRHNNFGAFEEAFDIMRTNLQAEQHRAEKAENDKQTLMAEIGHDIKTPLMSIRAVSENALVNSNDENYKIIIDKTIKIENLVNDIYHGTLDEIGELNVMIKPHDISDLYEIIKNVDYNGYTNIQNHLQDINLEFDHLRLTQVVENIIVNSYKYADTEICVTFENLSDSVMVKFKDYGIGVSDNELAHVMDKFYRGERVSESNGQGLGLYISRKLMERMGGDLSVSNDNGFVVEINIKKQIEEINYDN